MPGTNEGTYPEIPAVSVDPECVENILIIGSIGIGNLLLFSSTLRRIRRHFTNTRITVIVLKESFKVLYEHDPNVDRVLVLDTNLVKTVFEKVRFIINLRRLNNQICITSFPANRLEYNLLALLSGARWRIAHLYDRKKIKTLSFLQNLRVPVDKKLHDVEQNLNLLRPFGIDPEGVEKKPYLTIDGDGRKKAEVYSDKHSLKNTFIVGMHPGSSAERGMILKRWPARYFAELCNWLWDTYDARILLFGGGEEMPLRDAICDAADSQPICVTGVDFSTTAALIEKCACFITNDSGLMHVATALDVKTFALFGPSDPGRTAPYGSGHRVFSLGLDCSPCWSVNNLGIGRVNCIHPENICMTQLAVETVQKQLTPHLNELAHG
ncbi:glycosyltransferase family 9 protein [candidate division KSB1 bacterium]